MNSLTRPWLRRSIPLLLVCVALAATAGAQIVISEGMDSGLGGNNNIIGTVYGPTGQRITRRIQVRLTTQTRGNRVSMTDDNGNFVFRFVAAGDYTVSIDKEKEYEPFHAVVEIFQARGAPGGTYTVMVRLSARASTDAAPGVINAEFVNVPKPALEHFAAGQELAKAKDHKGAIEKFQLAIQAHPKFMQAYTEIGVQHLWLREFEKADQALLKALEISPDAFAPTMNRGIVLFTMKKFADAEPLLRKAKKMNESLPTTHYFLGQTLANLGKFQEAEKELTIAIKNGGPEMKEARRVRAILLTVRGERVAAASELEEYLKLAPNAPDAGRLRATIRQLRGASAVPAANRSNNP